MADVKEALNAMALAIERAKAATSAPEDELSQLAEDIGVSNAATITWSGEYRDLVAYAAHKRLWEKFRDLAYLHGYDRGSFPPIW